MLYKSRNKLCYYSGDYSGGVNTLPVVGFRKYVCIINVVLNDLKYQKIIMKKHYLIACILFVVSSVQAQLPNYFIQPDLHEETVMETFVLKGGENSKQSDSLVWVKVQTDTLKSSNDTLRFFLYGSAAINTTEDLQTSLSASQQFAALFRVLPFQPKENKNSGNGLDVIISMNALHLRPTGVAADSIDLESMLFPQTGNAGFIVGPRYQYFGKNNGAVYHSLSGSAAFALRQARVTGVEVTDTSGVLTSRDIKVDVINLNIMPVEWTFAYSREDLKCSFSAGLYYHWFNIPNEDAASFNLLMDEDVFRESGRNSFINALGMRFRGEINSFEFFTDIRYNSTGRTFSNDNPYKGFVYNAGFSTNLIIFSK